MKPYIALFRMRLIAGFQYRAAAWAGAATQFFWGFMSIMLYKAFYESATVPQPMPLPDLVSYMWMRQAFLMVIAGWVQELELLHSISSGQVAYELARPYNLFALWSVRAIAQRLSGCLTRCWPILLVAFFLPEPYAAQLPPSASALLLFVLSISLALLLNVVIFLYVCILTFHTLSPMGARMLIGVTSEFFAGTLIPLPMMPAWLQNWLSFLPFRYTADVPLRIYSGHISGTEAGWGIVIQVVWIVGLGVIANWLLGRSFRRLVVQGG